MEPQKRTPNAGSQQFQLQFHFNAAVTWHNESDSRVTSIHNGLALATSIVQLPH